MHGARARGSLTTSSKSFFYEASFQGASHENTLSFHLVFCNRSSLWCYRSILLQVGCRQSHHRTTKLPQLANHPWHSLLFSCYGPVCCSFQTRRATTSPLSYLCKHLHLWRTHCLASLRRTNPSNPYHGNGLPRSRHVPHGQVT